MRPSKSSRSSRNQSSERQPEIFMQLVGNSALPRSDGREGAVNGRLEDLKKGVKDSEAENYEQHVILFLKLPDPKRNLNKPVDHLNWVGRCGCDKKRNSESKNSG